MNPKLKRLRGGRLVHRLRRAQKSRPSCAQDWRGYGSSGWCGPRLHGLRRNIMRAALTTLGIIIGVAAVIAMMEIGRGSSSAIQQTIASMGANNLIDSAGHGLQRRRQLRGRQRHDPHPPGC